jgi:hypothetical protein
VCAQLVEILNGVNYLNTKAEVLDSSYKEQIKNMQEASTFVIPPKTVELLNEAFAACVKYDIPVVENAIWLFGILMLVGDGVMKYLPYNGKRHPTVQRRRRMECLLLYED